MLRLLMALQSVGGTDIPPDFDLQNVQPAPSPNAIVVTGRRRDERVDREVVATSEEPPLGRAETTLFGKVKGNVHVESQTLANGMTSQRVMVGIKLPF
jgi:hypothetical protein